MRHFHRTDTIADTISTALLFVPGVFIHFSRNVHSNSDHGPLSPDELRDACREINGQEAQDKVDLPGPFR
jgi:L-rhamnose isomerase